MHCPDALEVEDVEGSSVVGGTVGASVVVAGVVVGVTVVGIVKTWGKFTPLTSAPCAEAPHAWPCRLRSTARNARELAQTSVTPVKSSVLQLPP